MTRYSLVILGACLILLLIPALSVTAADQGDRVCIYKHDNFHGHEQCYRPGEQVSDLKHADVSSIRVFGHARVMMYEDRDFHGRMMEFSTDMPDLSRVPRSDSSSWHDHIGSLRVVTDTAYDRAIDRERYTRGGYESYPATTQLIDEGVCVYERPQFEGKYQCWTSDTGISDLSFANWKDKIASVRVFGRARLIGYKNTEFRGDRIVIDHDISDLSIYALPTAGNWNHEIASVEVQLHAE